MRCVLVLSVIALVALMGCEAAKKMPEKFLGTFKVERDVNFDEYLTERGWGWVMRRLITMTSVTKVIRKAASGAPNRYDFENLSIKKDTHHLGFELGVEFQDEALDSTQHKITFDMKDPNTLTERHIKVEEPTDVETYTYTIEGDYLVEMLTWNGVTAHRYYKKQ